MLFLALQLLYCKPSYVQDASWFAKEPALGFLLDGDPRYGALLHMWREHYVDGFVGSLGVLQTGCCESVSKLLCQYLMAFLVAAEDLWSVEVIPGKPSNQMDV